MVQLDYNDMAAAVKGGMADAARANDYITGQSAAAISFGFGLAILSTGLVAVPSSTGFTFVGIARQKHKSTPNSTAVAQYDIGEAISIVRKGRIWVESEQAVNPTLSVFLRHTVNSALVPGNFRVDADTAKADQITNAKWVSVTTGAGLAILEVNQP
jgi:hypothetical protein